MVRSANQILRRPEKRTSARAVAGFAILYISVPEYSRLLPLMLECAWSEGENNVEVQTPWSVTGKDGHEKMIKSSSES
ncbi:MAG: hypothetical protein CSA20_07150 [Deltaproteobacteria bacterium]|nr:MAG: hypothetical protein CSA20_07150 [Deltaproteobacteria bacterium]